MGPRDEPGTSGLGFGLGPIADGFLIENFDWPAVFLINVPVVITALLLGLFLVRTARIRSMPRRTCDVLCSRSRRS